ncbi:MAG: NAPDH-dependent diflavin reductase [Pleopsidium flavum]|nr:MAG: NAPDH-dependent diflavin reductase [Pleopsidium flavum]
MTTDGQHNDRTALILYGSETGNAQDVAEELGRTTERLHFLTRVSDLDSVDISLLSHYSVILITISTTGQGDLPTNAQVFWRSLLRKRLSAGYLEDVDFTTFGLGDSSYPKFNWAARKLHKRLCQLGANEIYPRGEADEQHPEGLDASFLPWSTDLRTHLLARYPLPNGQTHIADDVLLQPKWTLEMVSESAETALNSDDYGKETGSLADEQPSSCLYQGSGPPSTSGVVSNTVPAMLTARVTKNSRLTPWTHWQDVRHLTLITSSEVSYAPGDTLTIHPKNFEEDVDHFLSLMGWTSIADKHMYFRPTLSVDGLKGYPPSPIQHSPPGPNLTLRNLLLNHLDITAIPRRSFFSLIAHFTADQMHKERLLEFTNPDYIDELYDYTTRPRRSILEVLQEFESVKIPWQLIGSVLPVLRGRRFSIASGGKHKGSETGGSRFELLVAIVKYRTVIKKIREGVCTRYLAALPEGSQINVLLQKGGLNITKAEAKRPVVMVGPGTGVAPMRSLIWERLAWAEQKAGQCQKNGYSDANGSLSSIGENVLFFGCRNREADCFYQAEWEELGEKMGLRVFTAFSRDQKQKVYVQDLLREQAEVVYRLLHNQSGLFYICGSSGRMPQAVRESLIGVFQRGGRMEREAAEAYLLTMEKEGRYKQETW